MDIFVRKNQGFAVVLLIIILVVATAIGMFGLRSSQSTMQKIGIKRQVTELKYESEKGLQKAVRRIQNITTDGQDDAVAVQNSNASGVTGGDYGPKDIAWLLAIPQDTDASLPEADRNPPCNDWDSNIDFDMVTANVVCNFLGVSEPNVHVALVRKEDLFQDPERFAIYLINSIAYDSSRRRQITQGVVVVPYDQTGPTLVSPPYLSNSKTIVD